MIAFIDTSALVKLFHEEEGTDSITNLIEKNRDDLFISALSILEFTSALQRLFRAGTISEDALTTVMKAFKNELPRFKIRSVNQPVINRAEKLLQGYGRFLGLRTLDSIQLASYILLDLNEGLFVASDLNLLKAAKTIGINTFNPVRDSA